jgi:hypothetical protein
MHQTETFLPQQHPSLQSSCPVLNSKSTPLPSITPSPTPPPTPLHAAFYGLPPAAAWAHLVGWLKSMGVAAVLDLCDARDLALLETASEFIAR